MTAQISDFCKYDNETYNIIGKTDWFAFNPDRTFPIDENNYMVPALIL